MTKRLLKGSDIELYENEFDHLLARPEFVLGSSTLTESVRFFTHDVSWHEVFYVPAILKLFDEVISNAVDESIKTKFTNLTKIFVELDAGQGKVKITDSGRGIPILLDGKTGKYIPELVFAQLRTGSNFNDDENETLGRFGVGVSLTNLFSTSFTIHINDGKKEYKQSGVWRNCKYYSAKKSIF